MPYYKIALAGVVLLAIVPAALAAEGAFDLFAEEAKVVSASYRPKTIATAPATVHVVTAEEIKASGAQTIWDALRGVPGVEVAQTAAFQGEVGIRGLNGPLNNRVLVLLDGRTVLNANFDTIVWESIPITMEEIARIEVVEGPASALYGANAIAGVINIISKTPEQLKGGAASFSAGEAGYKSGSALYGARRGKADYKLAMGERVGNGFENEGVQATQTSKLHALLGYDFSEDSRLSVSGGLTKTNTRTTTGTTGAAFDDQYSGFLRADYRLDQTDLGAFWNRERGAFKPLPTLNDPSLEYDRVGIDLRHAWTLPWENHLVVGGDYQRLTAHSSILGSGGAEQDLWALDFENEWAPRSDWSFIASGRLDRHPLTPLAFSPRGSAIYTPSEANSFRVSAGSAFRNPTLIESYLHFTLPVANPPGGAFPNPPFSSLSVASAGSRTLGQERMFSAEVAHTGKFGPVRTTLTGFYYKLNGLILATDTTLVSAVPPTVGLSSTFRNEGGVRAVGFEAGLEAALQPGLSLFGNYSYQSLRNDDQVDQTQAQAAPRHKANAGARLKRGGLTTSLWADWVDKTFWNQSPAGAPISFGEVPDYFLLNGRVGYEFSGRWDGCEVSVAAFNLAARKHYEVLPAVGANPGMNGEVVRSRWTGTISYRFR